MINSFKAWFRRLKYNISTISHYLRGYEKLRLPEDLENPDLDYVEIIWGKRLGKNLYKLENIPFDEPLNLHDTVRCQDYRDHFPVVTELVSKSGNRALRVEFRENTSVDDVVNILTDLTMKGIFYERAGRRIYMFNVEPDMNYETVQNYLKTKEDEGFLWLYK